jgi:tRNA pseudouridine32 synthase/23S rRNA pseudouridine746 synthase
MRAASPSPRVARARAPPAYRRAVAARLCARGVSSRSALARGADDGDPFASADPSPPLARPRVVYEDDELLALDKPPGASFHGDDLEHGRPGVLALTRALQREGLLEGTEYAGDLHAVHRLDKLTSGILLLAKRRDVAAALAREFRERRVVKVYVALTARRPKKKMGTVRGVMTRARRGAWKLERGDAMASSGHSSGRSPSPPRGEAVTKFVSRGIAGGSGASGRPSRPLRLMTLRPLTGKTHQLRVACKSLGAPILGDARYADKTEAEREDRGYLHAAAMRLAVPSQMNACADGGGARRIVEIVCRPSVGAEWGTDAFQSAWEEMGLEDSDVWFPESPLLRSTRAELLT